MIIFLDGNNRLIKKKKMREDWGEWRGQKAKIFWPWIPSDPDNIWGNKYWECTFGKETTRKVEVVYNINYQAEDGTWNFSQQGKCIMNVSKIDLITQWTMAKL